MMDAKTAERILEETKNMGLVLAMQDAQTTIANTKPKKRHMYRDHPKYESFSSYVATKHNIDEGLIDIVCDDVYGYECSVTLDKLGGSSAEESWARLIEKLSKYIKL